MNSIVFIVLRRLRAPLIGLVSVYALTVLGLTLVPGVDADGRPAPSMSFFHAFYFVSYTATTIGFGEIPQAFSDAQRMWVTFSIYLVVVAWSYALIVLVSLLQDRAFQAALAQARFSRRVRQIKEPFYLLCGCGETGDLLGRALDRLNKRIVVVELREQRIQELELEDFRSDAPAIAADARSPEILRMAGLERPRCAGVIALTNDEEANLAVAMAVHLLNPDIPVLCRSQHPVAAAALAAASADYIINPFETFAEYLVLAMREPGCYRLLDWLTGLPGTKLRVEHAPPRGEWVVCGYGRFGRAMASALASEGLRVTIIDPDLEDAGDLPLVCGEGTEADVLRRAGIEEAEGLVAGTDNDIANLSIAVMARGMNAELFTVLRQNLTGNAVLFERFEPDLVMIPSEIIAHECLAVLITPLLSRFLAVVRRQNDAWADAVIDRLRECVGDSIPSTWGLSLSAAGAPAVHRAMVIDEISITLGTLLSNPGERDVRLRCIALMLVRDRQEILLPSDDEPLQPGDQLLFAGAHVAQNRQSLTLRNAHALYYVRTGRTAARGWLWRKLSAQGEPV